MGAYSSLRKVLFGGYLVLWLISCVMAQPIILDQPILQTSRPYQFGYDFGNGLGMSQYRHESADDTGFVKGTYGYQDPLGVYRKVEYNAGIDGYRAIILSNEPGLTSHVAANAPYSVQTPPAAAVAQGIRQVPLNIIFKK